MAQGRYAQLRDRASGRKETRAPLEIRNEADVMPVEKTFLDTFRNNKMMKWATGLIAGLTSYLSVERLATADTPEPPQNEVTQNESERGNSKKMEHYQTMAILNPRQVFDKYPQIVTEIDTQNADQILEAAMHTAVDKTPGAIFSHILLLKNKPYAETILAKCVEKKPNKAIENIDTILDFDFGAEIVDRAIILDPYAVISAVLLSKPTKRDILDHMANSKTPEMQKIRELVSMPALSIAAKMRSGALAPLVTPNTDPYEFEKTILDDRSRWDAMLKLQETDPDLGRNTRRDELRLFATSKVHTIDDLAHSNKDKRFKILETENYSPRDIFAIIAHAGESMYTSSFLGVFNVLLDKMKMNKVAGEKLLRSLSTFERIRFLEYTARFGVLSKFMKTIENDNDKEQILKDFLQDMDKIDTRTYLEKVTIVANVCVQTGDAKLAGPSVEKTFSEQYETAKKSQPDKADLIGIAASLIETKLNTGRSWFLSMQRKYELANLDTMDASTFFHKDKKTGKMTAAEMQIFPPDNYKDNDPHRSFQSLENSMNAKGAKKEDHGDFVIYYYKQNNKGQQLVVMANKPSPDQVTHTKQLEKIKTFATDRGWSFLNLVKRGHHSYDPSKSANYIPLDMDRVNTEIGLIVLAGCGSDSEWAETSQHLDEGRKNIITTQSEASAEATKILMDEIHYAILNGEVDWKKIKAKLAKHNNPQLQSYLLPNQNLGAIIDATFVKLKKTTFLHASVDGKKIPLNLTQTDLLSMMSP